MRKNRGCEVDTDAVESHALAAIERCCIRGSKGKLLAEECMVRRENASEGYARDENIFCVDENGVILAEETDGDEATANVSYYDAAVFH